MPKMIEIETPLLQPHKIFLILEAIVLSIDF